MFALSKYSSSLLFRAGMVAIVLVLLGLPIVQGCAAPVVGHRAPDFVLLDLEGNLVRLSELRGKVVFLNFWALGCPACRAEMLELEELYQEYKNQGVVIVGVDLMDFTSDVRDFVEENSYSWTFVVDITGRVGREYNITGIPANFFIDKDGVIQAVEVGAMAGAAIRARLALAMK